MSTQNPHCVKAGKKYGYPTGSANRRQRPFPRIGVTGAPLRGEAAP